MEKKKNFIINVIFYAMIGTAAFGVCKFVLPALVPFLIAFLLAALLQMPAKKLGKESEQRRRIAAILLCGAFYAVLFFIVIILGTKAVKGIGGMVVATFFMAADFPKITAFFQRRIPAGKEAAVKKGVDYVKNVIFIYIKSYFLLFSLTFVELSIGLLILRIPYAILLSLVIAVFDILPVLGTGGFCFRGLSSCW